MQKEILKIIKENGLTPFNKNKNSNRGKLRDIFKPQIVNYHSELGGIAPSLSNKKTIRAKKENSFKTAEARLVYNKVVNEINSYFIFPDTSKIINLLGTCTEWEEIRKRQKFFSDNSKLDMSYILERISIPKPIWKPSYSVVVVTENEQTFVSLKSLSCPVLFITGEDDVRDLQNYELIQMIDCDKFEGIIESLPQAIKIAGLESVFPERYLMILSGWKENLALLKSSNLPEEIKESVNELNELTRILESENGDVVSLEKAQEELERINGEVFKQLENITLKGESLKTIFNKGGLPKEVNDIIKECVGKSILPEEVFVYSIPLGLDENELRKLIFFKESRKNSEASIKIQKASHILREIPEKLQNLADNLILSDFINGISSFMKRQEIFPKESEDIWINNSSNLFLSPAQPISFHLNKENRCSILTGANSGGKTTLLEHIIQIISVSLLGLPCKGEVSLPVFSSIYYFAKNRGSATRGAFETLLTQFSSISGDKKTLILADEIESVTEPGVAGKIISLTASYFIKKECFLVIATHLGHEIKENLPVSARIDGIEARGLDEDYNLIVDHSPVLGKLANSTPELIIEKLAKIQPEEYLVHLSKSLEEMRNCLI
ncbi:hypothetical protein J4461_01840 [Candidatus Pacearchaeota archaeon]|nr:hypothetical protein [Candidatus Pacearchaeota archaeon]